MKQTIFGKFEYDPNLQADQLGEGAFAKVFRAYDKVLKDYVALKFFTVNTSSKYDIIGEITNMRDIVHPNLIRYYDANVLEQKTAYGTTEEIQVGIMEYANHGNLGKWMEKVRKNLVGDQKQKFQYIAEVIRPLIEGTLKGLAELHRHKILHRDIKPANILLHKDEKTKQLIPKIADFGLSKQTDSSATSTLGLKGTIEYMAPEQIFRKEYGDGKAYAFNTDLWAFGVVLHELFANSVPFGRRSEGSSVEEIMENLRLFEPNKLIMRNIPAPYQQMIQACLVKHRKDRIQTTKELLDMLHGGEMPVYVKIDASPTSKTPSTPVVDLEVTEEIKRPKLEPTPTPKKPPISKPQQKSKPKIKPQVIIANLFKSSPLSKIPRKYLLPLLLVLLVGGGLWASGFFSTNPKPTDDLPIPIIDTSAIIKKKEEIQRQAKLYQQLPTVLKELVDNMIPVKGGSFEMGCTRQSADCEPDEIPSHTVQISSFEMSKYEITWEQWKAVTSENKKCHPTSCEKCPISCISWTQTQGFLKTLNQITGKKFRLPTETEWEYAAKGGNKNSTYVFAGSDDIDKVAWHLGNSQKQIHEVGSKAPNSLGLYDMTGNVWEWCHDWYDEDYYSTSKNKDPKGPSDGIEKVIRGGSSFSHSKFSNLTNRHKNRSHHKSEENADLGFRIVRSL